MIAELDKHWKILSFVKKMSFRPHQDYRVSQFWSRLFHIMATFEMF